MRKLLTVGHCAGNGQTVIAQIATRVDPTDTLMVTLAAIGSVVKSWNSGIGQDFALVRINPGFRVVPGIAGALGPTGVFCGDPVAQPVMHYGHGYIFFVEQGYAKFGEVIPDLTLVFKFTSPNGFNWVGYGLPGDSGSGAMNAAGLACRGSSTSSARPTSSSPWTGAQRAARIRWGSEPDPRGSATAGPLPLPRHR